CTRDSTGERAPGCLKESWSIVSAPPGGGAETHAPGRYCPCDLHNPRPGWREASAEDVLPERTQPVRSAAREAATADRAAASAAHRLNPASHLSCRRHHVAQAGDHLGPAPGLQPAIRVDPHLPRVQRGEDGA